MNKSLILGIFSFLLVFGTSQLNAQKTKELEKQEKMAEKEAKKAEKEVAKAEKEAEKAEIFILYAQIKKRQT